MKKPIILAVDGPAGSGKSTICKLVAEKLGWTYVNTGALYRAIGVLIEERDIEITSEADVVALIEDFASKMEWRADTDSLYYENRNLTPKLGSVEAARNASTIAKHPLLRKHLLPVQRNLAFASVKGALVDGRDIGTVVFPDADIKLFITASIECRAKRRLEQLEKNGKLTESFEDILSEIKLRDEQDRNRDVAPLVQADDAILLDTTHLSINEAVEAILELVKSRSL